MKFAIEHAFAGISRARYEAVFFDEPFWTALAVDLGLGRTLIRLDREPTRIVRHVRFEPIRDPHSPGGRALGNARASFVEELDYDLTSHRGRWRTVPSLLAERIVTAGTLELDERGGDAIRRVEGDVSARLWGFGGRVERGIVAEIVKTYDRTAEFARDWLARA